MDLLYFTFLPVRLSFCLCNFFQISLFLFFPILLPLFFVFFWGGSAPPSPPFPILPCWLCLTIFHFFHHPFCPYLLPNFLVTFCSFSLLYSCLSSFFFFLFLNVGCDHEAPWVIPTYKLKALGGEALCRPPFATRLLFNSHQRATAFRRAKSSTGVLMSSQEEAT